MSEEEINRVLEAARAMVTVAMEENAALRFVCGNILAEIALLNESPPDKLGEMVAKLGGATAMVAKEADSPALTRVVDRVCSAAEAALKQRERHQ